MNNDPICTQGLQGPYPNPVLSCSQALSRNSSVTANGWASVCNGVLLCVREFPPVSLTREFPPVSLTREFQLIFGPPSPYQISRDGCSESGS
eukprot:365974-Chlamydomonas_euryale.AAC.12